MARMKKVIPNVVKSEPPKKRKFSFLAKMKSVKKRYVLIPLAVLVLAFAVTATVFFIPRDNTSFSYECWQLRSAVSDFLDHVCDGAYDKAAKSVFFVSESDATPLASSETLREQWAARMNDLATWASNTYLESYSDLSVRKEQGEMVVTVLLQIRRQGAPETFYQGIPHRLIVVRSDGVWKIQGISEEKLQTDFEKCISGRITPAEVTP